MKYIYYKGYQLAHNQTCYWVLRAPANQPDGVYESCPTRDNSAFDKQEWSKSNGTIKSWIQRLEKENKDNNNQLGTTILIKIPEAEAFLMLL